ncbi:MAG: lysophospholipid acyltransferase family protein [Gemmatimonadaceae bacterium]
MIGPALAAFARIISGASAHWTAAPNAVRQRVYFANHASHLDFVVIWSAMPPALRARTRPVAGADYWMRGPIKRYLARAVFRAILIERAGAGSSPQQASKSIEQIAEGMGDTHSIIVFPEGTRSMDGEVLPFKSGMFHLCRLKPELELVPVYLANMNRILPKGEFLPVPLLGRVIFGPPMRLEPGEEKAAFLTRARDALLSLRDR